MRAMADNFAVIQHDDFIGTAHGGQAVRNHQSGATFSDGF